MAPGCRGISSFTARYSAAFQRGDGVRSVLAKGDVGNRSPRRSESRVDLVPPAELLLAPYHTTASLWPATQRSVGLKPPKDMRRGGPRSSTSCGLGHNHGVDTHGRHGSEAKISSRLEASGPPLSGIVWEFYAVAGVLAAFSGLDARPGIRVGRASPSARSLGAARCSCRAAGAHGRPYRSATAPTELTDKTEKARSMAGLLRPAARGSGATWLCATTSSTSCFVSVSRLLLAAIASIAFTTAAMSALRDWLGIRCPLSVGRLSRLARPRPIPAVPVALGHRQVAAGQPCKGSDFVSTALGQCRDADNGPTPCRSHVWR